MYHTEKSRPTQWTCHHRDMTEMTLVVLKKGTVSRAQHPRLAQQHPGLSSTPSSLWNFPFFPNCPPTSPEQASGSLSYMVLYCPAREHLPWSVRLPPQEKAKLTPVTFCVSLQKTAA